MKRFYKFLMPLVAIVAMALPLGAQAQDTVTIGTGTSTSYYIPFNSLYGYSFTEMVYAASDIEMAGQITAVQFHLGQSYSSAQTNTITLFMKNVSRSSFTSSTDIEAVTASDLVFTGSWTIPANYTGWVTIELDTPFDYDGTSNLMVAMHESTSGYSTRNFTYTSVSNSAVQLYSDGTNPDPYNTSSYGGSKTTRNYLANMRLAITTGEITCNRVRGITATDIAPWSCTLSWVDTLNSGASYTVITMPDSTVMASGINDTTVTLTGLTPDHSYLFGVIADCGAGDESRAATVGVHTLVSCPNPTLLQVDSVNTSEITLSWTPGNEETSWLLAINDSLVEVTDNPYTITDLTANTVYTLRVRAICGDGDTSIYSSPLNARTLPGEPVTEFPYTCGFEDAEENAGWVLDNGSAANQWFIGSAVNNGDSNALYVSNNNGTSNAYNNGSSSHVYAYRYINFSDTGAYAFSFDWRCEGESHYYDYLRAWLVPASVNIEAGDGTTYSYATIQLPGCIDLVPANSDGMHTLAESSSFTTLAGEFRISAPGTYKLAFLWSNDGSGGDNPPAAVDNVFINVNACPAPYNLTVDYVSSDSITVSWNAGGEESGWLVSLNGGTPESVSATTYTFENLNANTDYNITVQADCGGEDVSIPASVSTRTACGTMSLPLNEDFNSYASSSYPSCWTRVMSGSYPYITTSYGNSIQFAGTAAVIAPYIAAPLNQMLVSFDLRKEGSSSGQMTFGYTSDPVAASDMVVLQTIDPATTGTYYHYEYDLSLDTNLASLDPDSVYYLVWRQSSTTSYWYYWLDNVLVEQVNPCTKPDNFVVNAAVADSVAVQWTEMGEATAWQLFVGPAGATPDADSAIDMSDTSYVFTNLAAGVAYDMYVRSDCGGNYSNWRGPVNVIPGSYIMGRGNATITMCGGAIYDDGGPNGDYAASFDGMVTIYPAAADSMLTFYGTLAHESCCDHLYIYEGVGDGGNLLWNDGNSSTNQTIPLDTCVSGPITIKWHADGSNVNAGFEIFVSCVAAPQCSPVEALTVSTTPASALVTWQPGFYGTYSGATVEYKVDTVETWTALPAVTGTYAVITGLNANTNYNLRVTTDCEGFPGGVATANFVTRQFPCEVEDTALSTTGTIGTGTSETSGVPVNSSWGNTMCQSIYLASELTDMGLGNTITSITYTWTNNSSYAKEFSIYMTNTSATEFTSTSASSWQPTGAAALVYNGPHPTGTSGSVTYQLATPFVWDGSSNICITTTMNQPAGASHSSSGFYGKSTQTSPQVYRTMYKYQDSSPLDGSNPAGVSPSSRSYYRPNITLSTSGCLQYGTCAAPAVAVTEVTTTTATVVWAPGNTETSWNLYYRMAGDANWSAPVAVTGSTYTVSGLTQGRRYEFMVENTCSGDTYAATVEATLLCAQISDLPFTENFNGWGTGVTPNCWSNAGSYSPTSYGIISGTYNHSGSTGGSIYMYSSSTLSNKTYLTLPELDTLTYQPNQLQLVFSLFYTSSSYGRPAVEVGVMSDPANASSFVVVDTVQHSGALSTWETFEVPMANYTGNGAYVAMRTAFDSAYSYFYLDDLTLEVIPTCPRPDSLTASNATTTTIDLGWHERSSASQWIVEYGPRGFELGTGTTVTANSNPFTLTGLPSSFQGEYYVKSICAVGDTSEYSRMACAFGTTQIPATLPYNYDFENVAEWNNWQTSTNHETNNWYRGTSVADSGSNAMYIAAGDTASYFNYAFNAVVNAAAYRDIDFGPVDSSYTLSFRARAGGTTTASYDGLMVFLVDPSVATVASTANITTPWGNVNDLYRIATVRLDTTWQTYEASFDTISGIHRVAFFWFNQNTGASYTNIPQPAAVDNIHIKYASCPRPVNLTAIVSEGGGASLSWQGPSNANYEITYRAVGDTVNQTVVATTNSYTLTGLQAPANYVYWVRKLCGVGDTSLYSDGYQFTTPCASVSSFPWVESFESEAVFDCWAQEGPGTWEWGTGDYSSSTGAGDGSYNILITHNSTGDATKIISPVLQLSGADATLIFKHIQRVWSGDQDELNVYYRTDQASPWVLLANYPNDIQDWTTDTVTLPNTTATYQIAFEMVDGYGYGVAIDSVAVIGTAGAGCADPIISMDNMVVGENAVTISFSGEAMQYEVGYVEGDTWTVPATTHNITDTFYTFTGLTAETQYTFGVRALCSPSNASVWATVTVTTDQHPCATPTALTVNDVTLTSATLGWTIGEAETQWQLHVTGTNYDETFTVTTNPYTLTGLTPAVTYSFTVSAVCSETQTSDPSEAQTFTTGSCQPVSGVVVSNVTTNSAQVSWTAVQGVNGYEVEYGASGFNQGAGTTVQASTNSASLTGLTANMPYDVYVRSVCAEGVYSAWSNVTSFTTDEQGEGIDDVNSAAIALYPNPATTTVTISGISGQATVTIVDMNGRVNGEWKVENDEITIDLTGYAQGAYFVRITGEQQNAIRKLIVK